jgi:hypothetical protein
MSKTLRRASAVWIVGAVAAVWAGCSSSGTESPPPGSSSKASSSSSQSSTGSSSSGGGSDSGGFTYTLIDDMETTTHGPIEYAGVMPPDSPGYWFNFGAKVAGDTASPPILSFMFTALPSPTTTYNGKTSMYAAYQACSLTGLYDVCGLGFEFAQVVDEDAGGSSEAGEETGDATDAAVGTVDAASPDASDGASHDASNAADAAKHDASDGANHDASSADASSASDATVHDASDGALAEASSIEDSGGDSGDAAPPIPKVTVPFDISQYKGITFWGKTTGADAAGLDVKVQFPDTDTDPRGGVCNSAAAGANGPGDVTLCYNSFAEHLTFTGDWQQFTVMFTDLQQDPGYGHPVAAWNSAQVYGINWQAQDNNVPDSGPLPMDFWIDDVYFIQ